MTLGIAWLRRVGSVRELVVVSDSRLSGGQFWDGNPKILLLPRSDAVISFAGHTYDAYPLMLQAYNAILMHRPAENRSMDICDLKGHLIRMFNNTREFITGLPRNTNFPEPPDAVFMLSGYSWKEKRFRIWKLHYDAAIKKFTFRPTHNWQGQRENSEKLIAYVGTDTAVVEAKRRLIEMLRQRGRIEDGSFDMEPFEVVRDIIRSSAHPSVGGPIQVVKIYEHSNAIPVGVFWPTKENGRVAVLGRPLMDYEKTHWGVIDPDQPDRARPLDEYV